MSARKSLYLLCANMAAFGRQFEYEAASGCWLREQWFYEPMSACRVFQGNPVSAKICPWSHCCLWRLRL